MKIYVSHLRDFDFESELYRPIRESSLNSQHEFFLPHEGGKHINTKDILKDSQLVLAEVSFPSTGQGIELGWANMFNVPILCISREGAKIAGSLKYITSHFITYKDSPDLISKVEKFLLKKSFK